MTFFYLFCKKSPKLFLLFFAQMPTFLPRKPKNKIVHIPRLFFFRIFWIFSFSRPIFTLFSHWFSHCFYVVFSAIFQDVFLHFFTMFFCFVFYSVFRSHFVPIFGIFPILISSTPPWIFSPCFFRILAMLRHLMSYSKQNLSLNL